MSDRVIRASSDEKVKFSLIDNSTLAKVMKRFLKTKVADPELSKWYKVVNGLDFIATDFGSAVHIYFKNKFADTFNKGTGEDFFVKPLKSNEFETCERIEIVNFITEGKKKVAVPTGNFYDYPDVIGFFDKIDIDSFSKTILNTADIKKIICFLEAMDSLSSESGMYFSCKLSVIGSSLCLSSYDSDIKLSCSITAEKQRGNDLYAYHFDHAYLLSILKSVLDFKSDYAEIYYQDEDHPIVVKSSNEEYVFQFAFNRKLVLRGNG